MRVETESCKDVRSRSRSTAFSPQMVGKVDVRTSTPRPLTVALKRPSCGFLWTAMSIPDSTFNRATTAGPSTGSRFATSCMVPSTRMRSRRLVLVGSRWMSLARPAIARARIRSTIDDADFCAP